MPQARIDDLLYTVNRKTSNIYDRRHQDNRPWDLAAEKQAGDAYKRGVVHYLKITTAAQMLEYAISSKIVSEPTSMEMRISDPPAAR